MPERWERELSRLRDLEVPSSAARARIEGGPRSNEGPPRHDRVLAALVAVAVAVVAGGFLWRTLPGTSEGIGDPATALPTLTVTFEQNGLVVDEPDQQIPRVDTTIVYGDAREESFTSALPANDDVNIRWVAAEDLTPLVPGPTVGSAIDFQADGADPRVLLGRPADWPNFDRFTRIDRLPEEPGQYILVFQADYPGGIARTPRLVQVVEPGVLQLVLRETGDEQALSGDVYVDGRGAAGFLSETSFTEGDSGPLEKAPEAPTFSPEAWLDIEPGSPVMLVTSATTATSGTFDSYDTFDPGADLPNDLLAGTATIEGSGRVLLAVEATWVHPDPGSGESATSERALFFFPIEIDTEPLVEEAIPPSPSPEPVAEGAVVIDFRRIGGEAEDPSATARFNEEDLVLCASGWSLVGPDGTREGGLADCNRNDEFTAPVGTPIVVTGDHASLTATAHGLEGRTEYGTDEVPALEPGSVVSYRFDVTWPDGSTASYGLFVTISGPDTSPPPDPVETEEEAASALRVRCTENGAEVLTPVVAAQVDGLHIVPVDFPSAVNIGVFSRGTSTRISWWSGSDGVDDMFVRNVPVGEAAVACDSTEMTDDEEMEDLRAGAAPFLLTDPNGYFTRYDPECDDADELDVGADVRGVDPANAAERIRSALIGVQTGDVVEMAGYPTEWGSGYWWRIVREERIVAGLIVGDQGGGIIHGWACRSSGIASDPSWPGP